MMYALIYSTELPEHILSPPTLYILMKNRSIRDHNTKEVVYDRCIVTTIHIGRYNYLYGRLI